MKNTSPSERVQHWIHRVLTPMIVGAGLSLCVTGCAEEFVCSTDYDCPGEMEICLDGVCEPFICAEDTDCDDPNAFCVDNRCVSSAE